MNVKWVSWRHWRKIDDENLVSGTEIFFSLCWDWIRFQLQYSFQIGYIRSDTRALFDDVRWSREWNRTDRLHQRAAFDGQGSDASPEHLSFLSSSNRPRSLLRNLTSTMRVPNENQTKSTLVDNFNKFWQSINSSAKLAQMIGWRAFTFCLYFLRRSFLNKVGSLRASTLSIGA